jgi:hypothetical protein
MSGSVVTARVARARAAREPVLRLWPRSPSPPPGVVAVTVGPGHPGTIHLSATSSSGDTLLTWQPGGQPMVTWDFAVEID